MSKKHHDIRKFIEMQLFFQSHSVAEIDENAEILLESDEKSDLSYMMLIEDMLTSDESDCHSIFGKYKH